MVANTTLMPITARPEPVMVRGSGSYLWDNTGQRYLDFIQGWAVNALGHCPQQIVDALATQGTRLITPSPALHNAPQLALADKLVQLSGLHQAHFSNSGSEANEVAIKLARKWGQINRPAGSEIITTHNSFHGRTLATMAAGGKPGWDKLFPPQVPGFKKVEYGNIDAMADVITENTLAIMLEPIQGEAGVIVPSPEYLAQLRQLADRHGVLLILDEIQTGVGRTGSFFAFEQHQIKPDIVTLGKGLGGGVPISATIAAEHVCCFEHGDQGGTYNGNPLMTAVALAVVDTVCKPSFLQSVQETGQLLHTQLMQLGSEIELQHVRGAGLLQAIELEQPIAAKLQQQAMDKGLIINAPRPATIRLMPALNVTPGEIEEATKLMIEAISNLR
jgi:acetylornithine/N-succinyldiaminopimelate aminotransferase